MTEISKVYYDENEKKYEIKLLQTIGQLEKKSLAHFFRLIKLAL
jgi:hypothetical protein